MGTLDTELAPGFLVAAPHLPDPNFSKTLVFLIDHGEEGAMGLVVNRPLNLRLSRLLSEVKIELHTEMRDRPVHYGGPVAPSRGWVLHDSSWGCHGSMMVSPGVSLNSSREVLEAIAGPEGPPRYHVCLGYSGWGPGQLEQEIALGSWVPVPCTPELIFETPLGERWEEALRSNGFDPALVISHPLQA